MDDTQLQNIHAQIRATMRKYIQTKMNLENDRIQGKIDIGTYSSRMANLLKEYKDYVKETALQVSMALTSMMQTLEADGGGGSQSMWPGW